MQEDITTSRTGLTLHDSEQSITKPKLRLTYEHIAHLHNKDFERGICTNAFIQKYSVYTNILQVLHVFRSQHGLTAYDPMPEEKLNIFIADKTPFGDWREFLVAAFEAQATAEEIAALEVAGIPFEIVPGVTAALAAAAVAARARL